MPKTNSSPTESSGLANFLATVRKLEKQRGSRIWSLIHLSRRSHICSPALWSVYKGRHTTGKGKKLEILVHSGGGHPEIAFSIMRFFRRRFEEVNVIVPLMAKSAATLMCLGADNIYMGEMGELGPIDIQLDDQVKHGQEGFSPLNEFKSLEFLREQAIEWMDYYATVMNLRYGMSIKEALHDSVPLVTSLMRPMFEQIDPIEMGGNRRALAIGEEYAKRMLSLTGMAEAKEIVKKMVWDYPSHDFCIDIEEASSVGLPISELPSGQDEEISEAILGLDQEHYHGFLPPEQSKKETQATRPVRQERQSNGRKPSKRVNGSAGGREEERLRA